MSRILVISGHPDLEKSYTNKVVLEKLSTEFSNIDIRRLDQLYPDYKIDVAAEHQALLAADAIILQFPFYWYSMPGLLKKWVDDVFTFNFAYGPEGDKLKGKDFFLSFTVGGPKASYSPLGYNHFTIEQFLRPMEQTAYLAGMIYHNPIYTHQMVYVPNVYNKLEDVQARARDHADRLSTAIRDVVENDTARLQKFVRNWFEKFDQLPEDSSYFIQYLAENINWRMPEGDFKGHSGFRDWYQIVRGIFKSDCQHNIEQVEIHKTDSGYQLDLRIRLIAGTYPETDFKGKSVNILVNEVWQVTCNSEGEVTIHDYQTEPVS